MKQHYLKAIKNLDMFGAPLFQNIDKNNSLYKSLFGGILTLLILITSLGYSITIVYQWQTNQLSPKIQHTSLVSDFQLLDLNYNIIKFNYMYTDGNTIDPFETNVLIPIAVYTSNYSQTEMKVLQLSNETSYKGKRYLIPSMKFGFTKQEGYSLTTGEMLVYFVKCHQSLLQEGQKCASNEIVEQFYSQPANTIIMQLSYNTLDSKDKTVKHSIQNFYLSLENQTCYYLNTYLQSTLFEINDALLFGSTTQSEYIDGAYIQSQTNTVGYCTQALGYGYETYLVAYFAMAGTQTKAIYDYPHASDILANIGSIVSFLFLLKYIVLFINQNSLQRFIVEEVIKFYYPQFDSVKITRNWFGNIKKVHFNKRVISDSELLQFKKFYKTVTEKIRIKFSIVNILYEMSRLYFFIRETKQLNELKKIHQIGIRLNFVPPNNLSDLQVKSSNRSNSQEYLFDERSLKDEDLGVLSLEQRTVCNIKEIPDELNYANDFYEINRMP